MLPASVRKRFATYRHKRHPAGERPAAENARPEHAASTSRWTTMPTIAGISFGVY